MNIDTESIIIGLGTGVVSSMLVTIFFNWKQNRRIKKKYISDIAFFMYHMWMDYETGFKDVRYIEEKYKNAPILTIDSPIRGKMVKYVKVYEDNRRKLIYNFGKYTECNDVNSEYYKELKRIAKEYKETSEAIIHTFKAYKESKKKSKN